MNTDEDLSDERKLKDIVAWRRGGAGGCPKSTFPDSPGTTGLAEVRQVVTKCQASLRSLAHSAVCP